MIMSPNDEKHLRGILSTFNATCLGEGDITGFGAIDFWSQSKKITSKWSDEHRSNWMS